jgi:amino acid permease
LQDWDGQSFSTIVSDICGFIVVLSGTIMLHLTKDFERSHSFRGIVKLLYGNIIDVVFHIAYMFKKPVLRIHATHK